MDDFVFADAAREHADKYQVPDGATRDIAVRVGEHLDGKLEAFDLIVMQRVSFALRDIIEDVYRPRSPLEAQLEYDRARKDLLELGIDTPEWVAAEDPEILERWARWTGTHDGG